LAAALTISALAAVMTSPVAAQPYVGASISRTSACHYTVTFTWESMGHGSNLSARVYLVAWEGSNSHTVASHEFAPKTGRTGYVSWDFVSTEAFSYQYGGYGELVTSRGTSVAKSVQYTTTIVPAGGESCA